MISIFFYFFLPDKLSNPNDFGFTTKRTHMHIWEVALSEFLLCFFAATPSSNKGRKTILLLHIYEFQFTVDAIGVDLLCLVYCFSILAEHLVNLCRRVLCKQSSFFQSQRYIRAGVSSKAIRDNFHRLHSLSKRAYALRLSHLYNSLSHDEQLDIHKHSWRKTIR